MSAEDNMKRNQRTLGKSDGEKSDFFFPSVLDEISLCNHSRKGNACGEKKHLATIRDDSGKMKRN